MQKIKHYIKEILLFIFTITITTNLLSLYKSQDLQKIPLQQIKTLPIKIDKTKPILIHFWATWCPTCSLEATNIQQISKDFQVITIAVKSKQHEIEQYMQKKDLDFKVIDDKDAILAKRFNISAYPTTFIYDVD